MYVAMGTLLRMTFRVYGIPFNCDIHIAKKAELLTQESID